mgnify:CR=1 FL=1
MKIYPGRIVQYNHGLRLLYVIIEVVGQAASLYNIKTGTISHMTVGWLLHNFLFL